jgi:hypothetical protein
MFSGILGILNNIKNIRGYRYIEQYFKLAVTIHKECVRSHVHVMKKAFESKKKKSMIAIKTKTGVVSAVKFRYTKDVLQVEMDIQRLSEMERTRRMCKD